MKPRQQRMLAVGLAAVGVAIAEGLTLRACDGTILFFGELFDCLSGEYHTQRSLHI